MLRTKVQIKFRKYGNVRHIFSYLYWYLSVFHNYYASPSADPPVFSAGNIFSTKQLSLWHGHVKGCEKFWQRKVLSFLIISSQKVGKHASEWGKYVFSTLFLSEKSAKDKDWQCNSIGFAMPFNTFGNTNWYLLYCKRIPFAAKKHIRGITISTISLIINTLH